MRKFAAVFVFLLLSVFVSAQLETGQITGIVTDASGAVVAGAHVIVTNVGRQTSVTATTTGNGVYSVTHLVPGTYKVTVSHPGFAQYAQTVEVPVGSIVSVDAKLKVGAVGETVEVSGVMAEQVNTETQTIQTVITSQMVTEMPSSTRNPYDLVRNAGYVAPDPDGRGSGYAVNGLRSASTDILLDGTENVNLFAANVGQTVPMDSVQEFSIVTSDFTAELGRASGGVVNVTTKSGTNAFHGSAYEFNRNSAISSNSFQNAAQLYDSVTRGLCTGYSDPKCPGRKQVYARNQFGFSIGGPVKKNKVFFFSNTEWLRVRSSANRQRWVLTPQFISALAANSQAFMNAGTLKSNLAPTTQVTAAQLQAIVGSKGTFATWAAANPTVPVLQGVNWSVPTDAGGGSPQNSKYMVHRVDINLSDRTTMYGRYALQSENYFPGLSPSPYNGYDVGQQNYNNNALFSITHSFTSSLASQSKVLYSRLNENQPLAGNPAGPTLYMRSSSVPTFNGQRLDFPGYLPEGPGTAIPFGGPQNLYQFNHDMTWTHGKHTVRFGGQFVHVRDNRTFGAYENAVEDLTSGSSLGVGFDNLMNGVLYDYQAAIYPQGKFPCPATVNPATGAVVTTVSAACSVQLPVTFPNFERNNRYNDFGIYAQDAFKLTPRFTLNLGLRWEYYGVQHSHDPSLESNFYLGSGATIFDQIRNGSVMLTSQSPVGSLWAPEYHDVGPRVGFAYDVFGNGKTALRGGYSMSYERNFGNVTYNVIQNPPNYAVLGLTPSITGAPILITTNNAGPLGGTTGTKALPPVTLRNPKQAIKNAYAAVWSLSIDHELARNTVASISYSGSRGYHLYSITNINRTGYGQFLLGDKFSCAQKDISVCGNVLDPQYSSANQRGDDGFSYYNGLNVGLRSNNFRNSGVTLTANYTWSHEIDNISNTFTADGPNPFLGLLDPWNPGLDKGNGEFDVRHRFTMSAIWNIPMFTHSSNKVLRNVLGGWEAIPTFIMRTGLPFSLYDCTNGWNVCPRYMPTTGPTGGSGLSNPISLYNPATGANVNTYTYIQLPLTAAGKVVGAGAYGNPSLGTGVNGSNNGNGYSDFPICTGLYYTGCTWPSNMAQRDSFRGPGNWNADFAMYKNFKLVKERIGLQIRGEMYDVFNHKNFYYLTGTYSAPSGNGLVEVNKADYRVAQLGARITF